MIFSPEGVVSSQDYEYQIKAICKMVSNRNHAFGAAENGTPCLGLCECIRAAKMTSTNLRKSNDSKGDIDYA